MLDQSEILPYHFLLQYTDIFIDDNGCWFNKRNINKQIYQKIRFNGKRIQAHVLSAILFCGHDRKLLTCHKCDIPACFNPNHLFSGTHQDNVQDAISKGRFYGRPRLNPIKIFSSIIENFNPDDLDLTLDLE